MALGTETMGYQQTKPQQQQYSSNIGYNVQQQQQISRQRAIAPAPESRSYCSAPYYKPMASGMTSTTFYNGTMLDSDNPSVIRRNARERNRVKQVNNGFLNLRQHIPQAIVADLSNGRRGIGPGADKKLSKVDTLRMAVEYIRRLKRVIDDVDSSDESSVSSYGSCGSSTMSSPSPPQSPLQSSPASAIHPHHHHHQSHQYLPLSYAGSFQQQSTMISPAASTSSGRSSDSLYHSATDYNNVPLKFEESFDDYHQHGTVEDEDILDYISLWQESA